MRTFDICVISHPSDAVKGTQTVDASLDPTVSSENPLGVTTILYEPNPGALEKLMEDASKDYVDLKAKLKVIEQDLYN